MAVRTEGGYFEMNEEELDIYMRFRELVTERGMPPYRAASVVMNDEGGSRKLGDYATEFERDILLSLEEVRPAKMPVNRKSDPYLPPMISFPGPRPAESLPFVPRKQAKK